MRRMSARSAAICGVIWIFTVLLIGRADASSISTFPLYDDPFSTPVPGTGSVVGGLNNNEWFREADVVNSGAAHDILLAVTAFQDANGPGDLSWDQSKNGWYGNVDGTTLLVTMVNLRGSLPWSQVADSTGLVQETYTAFGQTVGPPNAYPFIDLGTVGAGATDVFTLDFHFDWGDGRSGITTDHHAFVETVAANPAFVPEPSSLLLFGSGTVGLFGLIRRKIRA